MQLIGNIFAALFMGMALIGTVLIVAFVAYILASCIGAGIVVLFSAL